MIRVAALFVRVVASPHDPVDADLVADLDLGGTDERRADVALAGPVLTRLEAQAGRRPRGPTRAPARRSRRRIRPKK